MIFPKNVKYLTTPRYLSGGASTGNYANFNLATYTGDDKNAVNANRALLKQHFNLPIEPKWITQTHSHICLDASSSECVGDAVVTTKKHTPCAIMTADCLPIFAANTTATKVGIAHAGWQGILNGVIESFISQFKAGDLQIHFGAAISQPNLIIDTQIYTQFINKNPKLANAFTSEDGKYQLNIYQAAQIILNNLGVKSITGGGECTFAQANKYFSYRRDGAKSGRMAHLIWLE